MDTETNGMSKGNVQRDADDNEDDDDDLSRCDGGFGKKMAYSRGTIAATNGSLHVCVRAVTLQHQNSPGVKKCSIPAVFEKPGDGSTTFEDDKQYEPPPAQKPREKTPAKSCADMGHPSFY